LISNNYRQSQYLDCPLFGRTSVDGSPLTFGGLDQSVDQLISIVHSRQSELRCVVANLPFGIHSYLSCPVRYVAFLREPVDRCISLWYYAFKMRHTRGMWGVLKDLDFDLDRILASPLYDFQNDQVRMILGTQKVDIGEAEFHEACRLIRERYYLVGTVESFVSCIRALGIEFQWENTSCRRENIGDRHIAGVLPYNAVDHFREANIWDAHLHEWIMRDYLPERLRLSVL
jgi:hypothetical protein